MSLLPVLQGKKLTQLQVSGPLTGTEKFHLVDPITGQSKQADIDTIITLLSNQGGGVLLADNNLTDITDKAAARTALQLGDMSMQQPNNVGISGGNINNTPIGQGVPAAGRFTNLIVTGAFTLPPNSLNISAINGQIPNSKLQNSSFTVSTAGGISATSPNVALGGTLELSVTFIDGGVF